jgi:hypothetical protein
MSTYATEERIAVIFETTTEACFGAVMGLAGTLGMWGTVSFLFSYLVG